VSKTGLKSDSRKVIIARELVWHEEEANRRFSLDTFLYGPPAFDRVVQSSLAFLQMRPGELILDLGCGEGKETLQLVQQGLLVVSVDLSHHQLCRSRQRVQEAARDAKVFFVQANAEELPFASDSLDFVYGKAILHHLDIDLSAIEIKRILTQKGRASFAEPMAHHPLFWIARRLSPRLRTKDEHPLTFRELRHFGANFNQSEIEEHFLLTLFSYLFRMMPGGETIFRSLNSFLQRIDARLFLRFSKLKEMAWYGLIKIVR
jgi:SAM-dependent methyltransferase